MKTNGLRFSKIEGMHILLANKAGLIAVDQDTYGSASSSSYNSFVNITIKLGANVKQTGWRVGHVSGNGGDISINKWTNLQVYGGGPGAIGTGSIGLLVEGSNTLGNSADNFFTAFCNYGYSNASESGATGQGNGAIYFYAFNTSQNLVDIRIANNQSYLFSGGRFESGKRVLQVDNSNVSPSITFQATEINDYGPADGILFYVDMPCFLGLYGVNIQRGNQSSGYGSNMIKLYGGGEGTGVGRLIVDGGSIDATAPFYSTGNATVWKVYTRGVGRQNSSGVNIDVFPDVSP